MQAGKITGKPVKAKRKRGKAPSSPAVPASWDRGADGPANRQRLAIEPATEFNPETGRETPNPNGVKRRRRKSWVQVYLATGRITPGQAAAAITLRMAAEGMQERDPLAAMGDVRSAPGDMAAARIDARRYFRSLWERIPALSRPVVERVVLDDRPVWHGNPTTKARHFARLCAGLDRIS